MDIVEKKIITVAVITYNSSKTIIETLDSILVQTYGSCFIELIISDDGSMDNTVEIVELWLNDHALKFHLTKLFNNKINGGISKNCNVAWGASTSEWIKTIAGDDILMPKCITDNIGFVCHNPSAKVLFSNMIKFGEYGGDVNAQPNKLEKHFFSLPDKDSQREALMRIGGLSIAPSSFISSNVLKKVGYADTKYRFFEDLPLWFEMLKHEKFYFLNEKTVKYRVSDSTSNNFTKIANVNYLNDLIVFHKKFINDERISSIFSLLLMSERCFYLMTIKFYIDCFGNKKNVYFKVFSKIRSLLSLHKWYLLWIRVTR